MTKPYFKNNDSCLFQADCIDLMKELPENYVDMIFADPPYFLSNNGFTVHAGKRVSVNKGKWDQSKTLAEVKIVEYIIQIITH